MLYNFSEIEEEIKSFWEKNNIYKTEIDANKKPFYVLDMFPYPSGAGLHVGHPLGYIASDIFARYMRLNGFNVLHPMGYDAFGLPAEQYAIQTGQHPAITTEENIKRYRQQLDKIGFSYDWDREVKTADPSYYKWTQWIFIQLFNSWYDYKQDKARSINDLIVEFEKEGNYNVVASNHCNLSFNASEWAAFSIKEKSDILLCYRLAYLSETLVNWCSALGTVLANDEIKDGRSERGNHPVERKKMLQWSLRITAYAQRLLDGLNSIDWSDSIKEIQRNWIGKSQGAEVDFALKNRDFSLKVFTTRPDTIFGVSFMVISPEHPKIELICSKEQMAEVKLYQQQAATKSELDRMSETEEVTGVFTGAFVLHPFTKKEIPVYTSDYVLAGYGTGAIMAVPGGDQRDWLFANKFKLPIIATIDGADVSEKAFEEKSGVVCNSEFLNGLTVKEAIEKAITKLESLGCGIRKTNYKLRDAVFGRQRYWGEPIPIYYKNGIPNTVALEDLPVELPQIEKFLPTEDGDPPLGRAKNWKYKNQFDFELTTMPGWAGSSWYYLRYLDPHNENSFVSKEALGYWGNIDLYMGGAEHGTGHLLYFRFWCKFLFDLGFLPFDEPAKKLINQGMIQAEDGQKMSKRYGNVVNPDDVIDTHGADALRLHEMFLGPIEQHKPWNTKGIEGVSRFLKKYWSLFYSDGNLKITAEIPSKEALKILHSTIKGIREDLDRFSFNTVVSKLMVCVNELTRINCNNKEVLETLLILSAPYCPFISEALWLKLGNKNSIFNARFPMHNEDYLIEKSFDYPVMFNGKMRFKKEFALDLSIKVIESDVLKDEKAIKWLEGKSPKKVIVVPGKIINIVV